MIHLIADERHACAHAHGELTVGSRGIPVQVGLSDDFDGLAVTICFQAGTERAEVVWYEGEEINVPPQCLTKEGERLLVGVYGAKADGTVVIPTIWATAGIVKRGTDLTGASPLDPEPDWTAQVQSIAAEAIETANAVKAAADAGEFDGFSPSASVAKSGDTATITITDKDGTTTASIRDGYDTSGSVVQDGTTAIITLTDHDGTTRAEVHDGISPSASVAQTSAGATVTVTDRSGTTTAQITNGATGPQGPQGPQGPKGDTGDAAVVVDYGSGIILVQCDSDGKTKAWGGGFEVRAYVGAERQACTAAIDYAPSWLTINVTNNASGTPVVRYSWQQGQAASNATVGMTVTTTDVSGTEVTYPCTLNVTTVLDGAAGADGEDGYGFVPVYGTFVPIHTNPDNTTRAGRHELIFEAYSGSEELAITGMTFLGPSWITATRSTVNQGLLMLTWPDGETLVDSVGYSLIVTIDDHGTTRYEYSEIVVGAVKDGADGISPTVTVAPITGGHEVTVTDAGGSQSFDVMDGTTPELDAYSPALTAGAAGGITGGGPTDSAAWTERVTGGGDASDGPATIDAIRGRTVVWNQLCDATARSTTYRGIDYTCADGKISLSGTSTGVASFTITQNTMFPVTAGHKYIVRGGDRSKGVYVTSSSISSGAIYPDAIYTARASTAQAGINVNIDSGVTVSHEGYPAVFDLTLMFGAGNEPSTVAEFERMFPEAYYSYDAGSLLPVRMEGVESVDANGNVLQTREIPASTYFPQGMRSAGEIYDELTADAAVTRVGSVDLGTLNWSQLSSPESHIFRVDTNTISNIKTASSSVAANALIAGYQVMAYNPITSSNDKCFAISSSYTHRLVIIDHAYSDAEAFKAAMSGVMLYYELATPTTTPIDPPLNLTYRAEQGGTERVTHTDTTAPPTLDVTYGSTADGIRDRALSAIAPVEGEHASANYAVGSYLVHDGTLCKVTTAIASGEVVAIGTNVTVTTVMAEVIALTQ